MQPSWMIPPLDAIRPLIKLYAILVGLEIPMKKFCEVHNDYYLLRCTYDSASRKAKDTFRLIYPAMNSRDIKKTILLAKARGLDITTL